MPTQAKLYVGAIIAGGAGVLAYALLQFQWSEPRAYLAYLGLSILAALPKIRLPRMDGNYSLSFLFILIGLIRFSLTETLVAALLAGLVQSVFNMEKRPAPVQVAFNLGNIALSVGVCHAAVVGLLADGLTLFRPATVTLVAALYFVVNTVIVSEVLALLEGKPLLGICGQWYSWSFTYYLLGVAIVGVLPLSGRALDPVTLLLLFPPLFLAHFYFGLSGRAVVSEKPNGQADPELPHAAKLFIGSLIGGSFAVAWWAFSGWQSDSIPRFAVYLAAGVALSMLKIPLPRVEGTVSLGFVVLLAAVAELSLAEVVAVAVVTSVVQSVWRPEHKPLLVQILFNGATLTLSAALAHQVLSWLRPFHTAGAIYLDLAAATMVLYSANTLFVAVVVCLVEERPLRTVWQTFCFWSSPYYLVGAVLAGIMVHTDRAAGWPPSLLVMPLMLLVYVSYRLHVRPLTYAVADVVDQESA